MSSWLRQAFLKSSRPKESIIGVLRQQLGGQRPGRSMHVLHASDVTQSDFCPRRWAFFDLLDKKPSPEYFSTALDVTFRMGSETERLVVEEWAGDAVIGNWQCRYCGEQRSMCPKPHGTTPGYSCQHWWRYHQMQVEEMEHYGLQGAIDALFNIGAPQLVVTEVKILNPTEFDTIQVPFPEHRLRTTLYLKILEESKHPFREKINTTEGRVLYISRGYGKLHPAWNEILPFKEFVVKRNDQDLAHILARAAALHTFRTQGLMPPGICTTALDKIAKGCSVCQPCFSGAYKAGHPPPLT